MSPKFWFCDFECYQFSNQRMYIKEIAILSNDGERCYNYHIFYPCSMALCAQSKKTEEFQYLRHRLPWSFGNYTFFQAINDIKEKVGSSDEILIKGLQKCNYLKQFLCNVKCIGEQPSFNKLTNCLTEMCEIPHSMYCARRKVYELHYLFNHL